MELSRPNEITSNDELHTILVEIKTRLTKLYKDQLVSIVLFGSYAKGAQNKESDIDIAVILKKIDDKYEEIDRIIDHTYDIALKYDELISYLPVRLDEYHRCGQLFYRFLHIYHLFSSI
jgi:predicted nucleotidyltransferase